MSAVFPRGPLEPDPDAVRAADQCPSQDHPVWGDGSMDHFQCGFAEGHDGRHMDEEGLWTW